MATSCRSCQIAREIYKHFLKACAHIQTVKSLVLRSISGAEALKIHPGRLERPQPLAEPSALTRSSGNRKKDVKETDEYYSPTVSETPVCLCVIVYVCDVTVSIYPNIKQVFGRGCQHLRMQAEPRGETFQRWWDLCVCHVVCHMQSKIKPWSCGLKFCAHVENVRFKSDFFSPPLLSKSDTTGRWMQCICNQKTKP